MCLDTFSGGFYGVFDNEYPDEQSALRRAYEELAKIESLQPSEETGGQDDDDAIQDQVYIVRPDYTFYRVIG